MNVLSLFDGMSCGRIALERAGFKIDNYFASEINKDAMQVSKNNYPDIVQLGDITKIYGGYITEKIDLLIGGSPCQGFSFAGKQLNFNDPRSKLFFEFVRLKNELKPKYFLLENVKMKQEFQDIISEQLGVKPILINSSLVSAQNRERLYWTNIPNITQPKDKGLVLKDILDYSITFNYDKEKYKYTPRKYNGNPLCHHIGTGNFKGGNQLKRIYSETGKAPTLTTISGGCQQKKVSNNNGVWRELTPVEYERLQTVPDDYTKGVCNNARYTMLGNGWTVDVIAHIFSFINAPKQPNCFGKTTCDGKNY